MLDLLLGMKAFTETMSMTTALLKLLTEAKESAKKNEAGDVERHGELMQVLGRLHVEALRVSKNLEYRIETLFEAVTDYGLNPTLSVEQQMSELTRFSWIAKARLKNFREQCNSARRELTGFLDDVTAMLICHGRTNLAAAAFKEGFLKEKRLDEILMDNTLSISQELKIMLETSRKLSAELQERA